MSAGAPATLVLDTCTAITFARAGRLDLVTGAVACRAAIAARARAEIRKEPALPRVAAAERAGRLGTLAIDLTLADEAAALARYDAKPAFRGRGEAEVLALGAARGYAIASDEVAVLRTARADLGEDRALSSATLLRLAVREGRISRNDAAALLATMDVAHSVSTALTQLGSTLSDWLGS